MTSVEFVDTNILLYAYDGAAGSKNDSCIALLEHLAETRRGALSIQVLVEFYSAATRKFEFSSEFVEAAIGNFSAWQIHRPDFDSIMNAVRLQRRYQLSWFDAMIVNSAIESGCSVLWTEDLKDGQKFGPLTIRNPFKNKLP